LKKAESIDALSGYPIITIWGFYNVLTAYITLYAASLNHRVALENRLRVAMRRIRLPRPRTMYRTTPERWHTLG
jgi:hypothetical protein